MIEEEFLSWLDGNVSPYSFLVEYFYGDCEVENVTLRKELLYKWMLAAFSEGWQAGQRRATIDGSSAQANV